MPAARPPATRAATTATTNARRASSVPGFLSFLPAQFRSHQWLMIFAAVAVLGVLGILYILVTLISSLIR